MLIYKCAFSGDELFSDSYPQKLVDDLIYEVEGKNIKISGDIDEALIGGNAATEDCEDAGDGVDSNEVSGINIVLTHNYTETSFDKAQFKDWLKTYMKQVKKRVQEQNASLGEDAAAQKVKAFEKGMSGWAMKVLKSFDEYKFYLSENVPENGMVILMGYREDQITPYFTYFKDALEEEKF